MAKFKKREYSHKVEIFPGLQNRNIRASKNYSNGAVPTDILR